MPTPTPMEEFVAEVRFSLRIMTATNASLNAEIQRWVNEAILDLTKTTDIKDFTIATADAMLKGAIIDYCHFKYDADASMKSFYKDSYDSAKEKLLMSSTYANVGGVPDADS